LSKTKIAQAVAYAFVLEASSHAELSASSADRWMTCPGSVALSAGVPNHSSAFAAQGTAAHHIAAECQKAGGWFTKSTKPEYILGYPVSYLGQKAMVEGHEIELDEELIDAVDEFMDDIRADAQPGDVVFVEQSFTEALKKLHPKFGGSGDRVRWRPSTRHLRVTDYKHGAGIPVDVDDNRQLKKYALGALLTNPQFNAEDVELRIAQPRCDHEAGRFRSYTFKAIDLLEYAADLMDAAKATEEFGAPLVPSKKACKWCPANAANKCPAIENETHALTRMDFEAVSPASYSPEQIAEFLTKAPLVEARISAMREFAYAEACKNPGIFPGWKIVDKQARRKWTDEAAVESALADVEDIHKIKLKSPNQIEKQIGKKEYARRVADFVAKESSGHTLAPASDPRPPAQVALLTDFGVVDPE
jgi:hypothetical protein